jgi:hypothetical protein
MEKRNENDKKSYIYSHITLFNIFQAYIYIYIGRISMWFHDRNLKKEINLVFVFWTGDYRNPKNGEHYNWGDEKGDEGHRD